MSLSTRVLKPGEFNFDQELLLCDNFSFPVQEAAPLPKTSISKNQEADFAAAAETARAIAAVEAEKELARREGFEAGCSQGQKEGYETGYKEGTLAGHEAGYLAGQALGYDQGKQDGYAETKGLISEAVTLLKMAEEKRGEIFQSAELELVELAVKIAEKVIDREVSMDKGIVQRTVHKALMGITQREGLVLRVSPEDIGRLTEGNLLDFGLDSPKIIEDPKLRSGDCIIDCKQGRIDATLNTQLTTVARKLGVVAGG